MQPDAQARIREKEVPLRLMAAAMLKKFGGGAVSVALAQAEVAHSVDDQIYDRWQAIARSIQEHSVHEGHLA